jgi:hypothetical protein
MQRKRKMAIILPVFFVMLAVVVMFTFPASVFACGSGGGTKVKEPVVEPIVEKEPIVKTYEKDESGFSEMLYNELLGREPEQDEITFWKEGLTNGSISPSDIVNAFLLGQEGHQKYGSYNDSQFVDLLYNFLLKRAPDEQGYATWMSQLSSGTKREDIINSIAMSGEFADIWKEYGITQ